MTSVVAACGGDTVKVLDVSSESCDPCMLSYTPSPGFQLNCIKWNHTNLVVASAGDDKRISLWRKNGESLGTIPLAGTFAGDNIEESISAINFSNKSSRYICSGGSSQIVRIWDLQRNRCIKWLKGHTDTISGAMYNCKDEHLASVSLNGCLIIHNLASGSKASEFRDPNDQVLRVLDCSRISRHLLVTSGDDGSVHVWDTTGRGPKVSWLKQHSSPTSGLCFSPSNDKIIASVGLDKKLFIFDVGSRRAMFSSLYESPFSTLAFADDGLKVAAGTTSGRIIVYDVRGKPQPLDVYNAYGSFEAVTSLCWSRSKPIVVNESNCTDEMALFGGATDDSIVMPDPLPSITSSSLPRSMGPQVPKTCRFGPSANTISAGSAGSSSSMMSFATSQDNSTRSDLPTGRNLRRLRAPHDNNSRDDMEVFSPVVEVQPFSPSMWDEHCRLKKDFNLKSLLFPSRRFLLEDRGNDAHPVFDWKSSLTSEYDDPHSSQSHLASTPSASSKSDDTSSIGAPEAGVRVSDKFTQFHNSINTPSCSAKTATYGLTSEMKLSGAQYGTESTGQTLNYTSSTGTSLANWHAKELENQATSVGPSEHIPSSSKYLSTQIDSDFLGAALSIPNRLSNYAERISTTSSFSDGTALSVGLPKNKKTGTETKEEILSGLFSRHNVSSPTEAKDCFFSRSIISSAAEAKDPLLMNGGSEKFQKGSSQHDSPHGSSFSLQLIQQTLEETLSSFQKSIHNDIRNLHIEILRQSHMQEMETSSAMEVILNNQSELMKEVQLTRKELEQLRRFL